MHAHIVYTEMNYTVIVVVNDIYHHGEQTTSNVFYYIYASDVLVPQVIPRTYNEAMWYLDGRRRFRAAMNLDGDDVSKIDFLKFPN